MAEASRNNTGVGSSVPVSSFESFVSEHFVRLLVGSPLEAELWHSLYLGCSTLQT